MTAKVPFVRRAIAARLAVRGPFAPAPPYRIVGSHRGTPASSAWLPLVRRLLGATSPPASPPPAPGLTRCLSSGFWSQDLSPSLSLADRHDYQPLPAGNPFAAGTIVGAGGRSTGFLRIAGFGEDMYLDVCAVEADDMARAGRDLVHDWTSADTDALFARVNARLTAALAERIRQFNALHVDTLIVDVTGNGGGSDWAVEVAPMFAAHPLQCPDVGMVRHAHWRERIARSLVDTDAALRATSLSPAQKATLVHARALYSQAAEELAHDCDTRPLWTSSDAHVTCSNVVRMPAAQCSWPPPPVVFLGQVVLLTDGLSASATEQFVAMLRDYGGATVAGQATFGIGCGYTDGGIPLKLRRSGLSIQVPDCVRYRRDGSNEALGIAPDIVVDWQPTDTPELHTAKALTRLRLGDRK